MDSRIKARYNTATPFDESDLALSSDYHHAMRKLLDCLEQIEQDFGPSAAAIANELLDSAYEVTELEVMHFFQEGYRAALIDSARAEPKDDKRMTL